MASKPELTQPPPLLPSPAMYDLNVVAYIAEELVCPTATAGMPGFSVTTQTFNILLARFDITQPRAYTAIMTPWLEEYQTYLRPEVTLQALAVTTTGPSGVALSLTDINARQTLRQLADAAP